MIRSCWRNVMRLELHFFMWPGWETVSAMPTVEMGGPWMIDGNANKSWQAGMADGRDGLEHLRTQPEIVPCMGMPAGWQGRVAMSGRPTGKACSSIWPLARLVSSTAHGEHGGCVGRVRSTRGGEVVAASLPRPRTRRRVCKWWVEPRGSWTAGSLGRGSGLGLRAGCWCTRPD